MSIHEKLLAIQADLDCPKSKYNAFGKYNFRNAEDIMEAVKPLCVREKCVLTVNDEVEQVGDRYYIKSTATLTDCDGENVTPDAISASASAREADSKSGMDSGQLSGATASYARKYALGALFAIDDGQDLDSAADGKGGKASKGDNDVDAKLSKLIAEIDAEAKALPTKGIEKTAIAAAIKEASGYNNYNKITDMNAAKKTLAALKKLGGEA